MWRPGILVFPEWGGVGEYTHKRSFQYFKAPHELSSCLNRLKIALGAKTTGAPVKVGISHPHRPRRESSWAS